MPVSSSPPSPVCTSVVVEPPVAVPLHARPPINFAASERRVSLDVVANYLDFFALEYAMATACFCGLPECTNSLIFLEIVFLEDPLLRGITYVSWAFSCPSFSFLSWRLLSLFLCKGTFYQ